MKGLDDGLGIGGVGVADGVGVDVSVSEWSLQADPARSRNVSAMLLSSFFTIECYDSTRQRNQIYLIYLERSTSGWTGCKSQADTFLKRLKMAGLGTPKESVPGGRLHYLPTGVNERPQRSSIHSPPGRMITREGMSQRPSQRTRLPSPSSPLNYFKKDYIF